MTRTQCKQTVALYGGVTGPALPAQGALNQGGMASRTSSPVKTTVAKDKAADQRPAPTPSGPM